MTQNVWPMWSQEMNLSIASNFLHDAWLGPDENPRHEIRNLGFTKTVLPHGCQRDGKPASNDQISERSHLSRLCQSPQNKGSNSTLDMTKHYPTLPTVQASLNVTSRCSPYRLAATKFSRVLRLGIFVMEIYPPKWPPQKSSLIGWNGCKWARSRKERPRS